MNFFQNEIEKIMDNEYPYSKSYIGKSCYVRLSGLKNANVAKIEFHSSTSTTYDGLQISIINRNVGKIDTTILYFADIIGLRKTDNPNFKEGIIPHVWQENPTKADWYVYKLTDYDYTLLGVEVLEYLHMFEE